MSKINISNIIKVYQLIGVNYIHNNILEYKKKDSKYSNNSNKNIKSSVDSNSDLLNKSNPSNKESQLIRKKDLASISILQAKESNINEKLTNNNISLPLKQETIIKDQNHIQEKILFNPKTNISSNDFNYIGNIETISKIKKDLESISSYEDLKIYMESFDDCDLKKTANHTVLGDGNINSDILIIGEAPGKEEDLEGKPFVGRSGALLLAALNDIGLYREKDPNKSNFFITNTIFWRPPGNRNPSEEELSLCFPILEKIIEIMSPKLILTVGEVPSKMLINNEKSISELRKTYHQRTFNFTKKEINVKIKALYHPAYLLRMPTQKISLWKDLISVKKDFNLITMGEKH